jgi:ketosteroid isomerase-like protein
MRSNLQIVSEHYAASDRGDLAAMLADVAPDARWTEMAGFPCAGTWVGPAHIAEHVFKVLGSEWNDYRMTLESLVDGGDRIVGIGTYSGTYKRTGRAMQARVAHVWRLTGGKIVAFEQFTDTLLVAKAMET